MDDGYGGPDYDSAPTNGDSFLSTLTGLANTGANVYRTVNPQVQAANHPLTQNVQARTSPLMQYLPWAIGGLIVIVVLGLVFRRK